MSVPPTIADAVGAITFCVTIVDAKEEHPFTGLVTVSVYVPIVETTGFFDVEVKLLGPVHS